MCGIFGVFGHPEAANITYLGLYAVQHRGQESAGIVSLHNGVVHARRKMGLVADVFKHPGVFEQLPGRVAIGHVRYSTTGASRLINVQPFAVKGDFGNLAIAHNGNLVNTDELRALLEKRGAIFQSTMDTEVIIHLVAFGRGSLEERLKKALGRVKGAYSLVLLTDNGIIAARDPHGFRPLALGKLGRAWVVASETSAFDLLGAKYERDIAPGEILFITKEGIRSIFIKKRSSRFTPCLFEYVYFARPDSLCFERSVYEIRKRLGVELAREHPAEADMVVAVPDSGVPAAIGYSQEAGIPFEMGLIRNHYVGRTFIEPKQSIRNFGVKLKLNPLKHFLKGKDIVVIDDSIVRGTTSRKIVNMLRQAGARKIHVRISSPPTAFPCFYGIDTPTRRELIANRMSIDGVRDFIGADSLGYLSLEGLYKSVDSGKTFGCDACWTGDYPIK